MHPFNLDQIPASAPSPFFLCGNTAPVWPVWETNGTITDDAPVLYIFFLGGNWGAGRGEASLQLQLQVSQSREQFDC